MQKRVVFGLTAVVTIALALSASLDGKGATTRIAITGAELAAPVQITDPSITSDFFVWSGPGTYMNGVEGRDGFIVDWASGAVERPAGLRHFDVSFYTDERASGQEELVYVVSYECDAAGREGYVYLPGRGDSSYAQNVRSIFHGAAYEGHWLRATDRWRQVVRAAIARDR